VFGFEKGGVVPPKLFATRIIKYCVPEIIPPKLFER
jgi:hypothetical protein